MLYTLPDIRKANISGKKIFLRADTDVPLTVDGNIEDDTRLKAWFPTLQYLLEHNSNVVIGGKLGRPEGIDEKLSLEPVAQWLSQKINDEGLMIKDKKVGEFDGWEITPQVTLLENLQFFKEEAENDKTFAQKLANLAEIYVNDAFAVSHRNNASVVGICQILPHYVGFRLQEEIQVLSTILEQPQRPLVVVIGGAKIETKLPLVTKMLLHADFVLVGGKIASEREKLGGVQNEKLHIAYLNFDGTDITERSVEEFINIINQAKTIVWNGPLGLVKSSTLRKSSGQELKVQSLEDTEKGTREIANAIAESSAQTIVGGGDTLGFIHKMGIKDKFSFVSTGGGAMLAFLSGESLPGLEALKSE